MALLGKAHLFNEAAHTGVFSDVIFRLFWQDWSRPTANGDGLKAAEMLSRICGWNEPERVNVQSVEVKVDAALIEQLRAGYAEMNARRTGEARQLADSVAANSEANGTPKRAGPAPVG